MKISLRSVTQMIDGNGLLTYEKRLESLGLTTLLESRARGDLIENFKIFKLRRFAILIVAVEKI